MHEAAHFFASSRTANLLEHQLIEKKSKIIDVKFKELYDLSLRLNKNIIKKYNFDKDFVLHPDTYRLFTNDCRLIRNLRNDLVSIIITSFNAEKFIKGR